MAGDGSKPRGRWRRLAATAALTSGVLVAGTLFAASASAHVKVSGIDAVQGGAGVITFRVPSESATAATTGLLITFPASTPFTEVDVQPKAGWHATLTKKPLVPAQKDDDGDLITEYVSQVDFTADSRAAGIPPGEFDMFNLSVGPFPDAASMSFAALQTYSDGTTVNWDEQSANGAEPEHPAPTLQLAAAATASSATVGQPSVSASAQPQASGSSGGGSSWTGIIGLIAGLLALVISLAVLAANRSRGKATPSA
ncbi:MAG TPA: YcnI family protein [Streptosporangiaceae bacterium]|nr:YcnI family protein [Streptosporangiaceae bacterium]